MAWRLICDRGQQVWEYLRDEVPASLTFDGEYASSGDKVHRENSLRKNYKALAIDLSDYDQLHIPIFDDPLSSSVVKAALEAVNYYVAVQDDDGHWPADYAGPMFLLPGAVITGYVTGHVFSPEQIHEMTRYLFNHQLDDGGWGIHIESTSTMFGTVLNYISLRLMGVEASEGRLSKARRLILDQGGAMFTPSWAKFWLCVLGVMPWNGVNSLFPELWLAPHWVPVHPSKYWCHCRMVYLPMSYVYAEKIVGRITPLVLQLREELYRDDYLTIDFSAHRNSISTLDLYSPPTRLLRLVHWLTNSYERVHSATLRDKASEFLLSYIEAEDEQTNFIDIGPVNKFINMLAIWHARGGDSDQFRSHCSRVPDYLWLSEDGMKLQGYNGSQLWDTAFSVQAIIETGFAHLFSKSLRMAYDYVELSQVLDDVKDQLKFYRHTSKGGWPFSTRDHGWPVTDCTAEGIKSTLLLHENEISRRINDERLEYAVDFLLASQNTDGGWATYEIQRTGTWIECLNPAEVFKGIMVDYSCTECTSACIQALCRFRRSAPFSNHRRKEIDRSVERGKAFLKQIQRSDGSWYGNWAVCFTYGIWFAIEALIISGEPKESSSIQRGIAFLLSKQNVDGGWGESYLSSVHKVYVPHRESQVINTSWAVLSLLVAQADPEAIRRGIQFILKKQRSNGDWDQENISGVFNGNCMISYSNYRNIFPIWALGKYIQTLKEKK